jgi:cephalosporin hydroxylase
MFNEENINRRSNLQESDSLSCYMGHCAQQNPNAFKVFYDFLDKYRPNRILEIGTAMGGFTIFLKITCDELGLDIPIRSYDIHGRQSYETMIESGIDVRVEDIFTEGYQDVVKDALDFIQDEGSTLVLCDGGHKISEFNLLSKFIKSGDYIMAHDYASDSEYFNNYVNGVLWNWHEIQDSDIQSSVDQYNLKPFMQDEFQKAVWVSKIKE